MLSRLSAVEDPRERLPFARLAAIRFAVIFGFLRSDMRNLHACGDGAPAVVRHRLVPRPSGQEQ